MEITVPFASYKFVRFFAVFGGIIGVVQSSIWIGLGITAILGYFCQIDFAGTTANYGTILQLTLYQMYFKGDCTVNEFPVIDFEPIERLSLMKPSTVNIWMYVVIGLSAVWLFSSLTLITNVKKSSLKYANIFLYTWVLITFCISMIDLVLFIFFVLDFDTLLSHSITQSVNFASSASSILLSAQISSSIMFSVALRGYVLWIINMCVTFFLFTQTFKIYDYIKLNESEGVTSNGYLNNAYKSENDQIPATISNQPIKGYASQTNHPWYNYLTTDIPRAKKPTLVRSVSATMLDQNATSTDEISKKDHTKGKVLTANFEPKPQLRGGILRNSRYQ